MTRFVTQEEVTRLKSAEANGFQGRLYAALRERAYAHTKEKGFVQTGNTQEWWHLCWERASDAAFVWYVERDQGLGEWLRDAAFWLRDLEDAEWIGPWYRNHTRPLVGSLETAHVAVAMCEILDLCADLFNESERASLEEALRVKGMEPCRRFCMGVYQTRQGINNWYSVLLSGFGVCALYFEDDEAIEQLTLMLPDAHSLYNADSYGESLQYSNYASLALSFLQELMFRFRPDLAVLADIECYGRMMDWYAANFLYMKKWDADDITVWPRSLNNGDSAAVFRATGDLLAQVAVRCKQSLPRQAALASWMLETTYTRPDQGPDELATFGFYPNFRYHAVLMQPDMAPARSPAQVGLCEALTFENGQTILRDRYDDGRAVLAVQGGYAPLNVSGHRHQDHGALQFAQGTERMIIDGGHCCYRLNAQKYSVSTKQHATMDFVKLIPHQRVWNEPYDPFDGIVQQKCAEGNFQVRREPLVKNGINQLVGDAYVLTMDLTSAYGDAVRKAQRAIISAMPNAVFIIDIAETAEPLRMQAHFPMNNRDGALKVHQADEHRLVFRRNGEALKLFECINMVDGLNAPSNMSLEWGYCHRNYHPLHAQAGQSKEGSAELYTWTDKEEGRKHLRVCAIASDLDERITGWHIKADEQGCWYIESPEKQKLLVIRVAENEVTLVQRSGETRIL